MLYGEYRHTIDDKRRVAVPAKFRKELGKKVVITHGLDNCLFIFPMESWGKVVAKMETLSLGQSDARAFGRYLFAGAQDVEVDSLGRILVPDFLAKAVGIVDGKTVLIGVHDRLEMWSETQWDTYKAGINAQADTVAEKLSALGVL